MLGVVYFVDLDGFGVVYFADLDVFCVVCFVDLDVFGGIYFVERMYVWYVRLWCWRYYSVTVVHQLGVVG